ALAEAAGDAAAARPRVPERLAAAAAASRHPRERAARSELPDVDAAHPRTLARGARGVVVMTPRVTVVMSVYNGERYLAEAIDSILAQTYRDFELLVIDDASTDRTAEIVAKYHDERIRVLRNDTNRGLTVSLNIGLGAARGELIARHDADDRSRPRRLEE